jgi:hypothetical protein
MPSNPKHQTAFERACADARCTHQNALAEAQAAAHNHPDRHQLAKLVAAADRELNDAMAAARAKLLLESE